MKCANTKEKPTTESPENPHALVIVKTTEIIKKKHNIIDWRLKIEQYSYFYYTILLNFIYSNYNIA